MAAAADSDTVQLSMLSFQDEHIFGMRDAVSEVAQDENTTHYYYIIRRYRYGSTCYIRCTL